MKSRHTPEIRFAGFTGDWEQHRFEKVLNKQDGIRRGPFGSALKKEFFVKDSDYAVYEQQNAIYDNYETRYNITKEKFEELKNFQLSQGDFILSGAGTIGRISRVPKDIKQGVFNQALIRFKIDENITDSEYFIQWIRSENMQRKLTGANPGSAITNLLPMSEVKKWDVMVPSKNEQIKIGKFFKQLDDTIALLQQELTTLKQTKQGFLQKMFPKEGESVPDVRFPGFTGDWEQRKLDSMVDRLKSYSLSRDVETNDYTGYKYIHYGDIHKKVADIIDESSNLPNIKAGNYELLEKGDLVLADASEDYQGIATPAVITIDMPYKLVSGLHTIALRPKQVDSLFLYYLISSPIFRKYGYRVGTGMKVFGISVTNLLKFESIFPSLEEQTEIGNFFKQLDNTIALHQRELDTLKETKKAFLQKMFI
ncbi:hypothetical protein MCCC1A01412_19725 [Bacillus anthracis]|uniref:restriction endonuclease subunit S n=1 Tax=Bacillus anthracis TaxID=1392 RepID=UPI0008FDB1D9|nr:restriction endonuclease subunit S [Bacillus anthracis]AXO91762.1 restriction endonuclease subunit S [Bacillus anthracis]OJD87463.1 hypothetical protein MCCC1A01412_19725 [Bacillus anthracis]